MLIESSAPTRIDLAGGTLDIWPLYLFHERAQTLNAAISLRAYCSIRPRADKRLAIVSEDTGVARRGGPLVGAARQPRPQAARPPAALLPGRRARAADAVRFPVRRRHRRVVGAEHRRLRRAGGVVRAAADRRPADADRAERRGTGHRRARPACRTTVRRSTAAFRRWSSASTAFRRVAAAGRAGGAASRASCSPTPTPRATPGSTTGK